MASKSARSRRNLSYREKLLIVRQKDAEPSWTQRSLALWAKQQFRLARRPTQATISNLLRDRDKLLNVNVPPAFRSARRVRHPELDRRVAQWVRQALQGEEAVTRTAIQRRALALVQELQLPADLAFSKGWVTSFLKRHQLNCVRRQGEGGEQVTAVVAAASGSGIAAQPTAADGNIAGNCGAEGLVSVVEEVGSETPVEPERMESEDGDVDNGVEMEEVEEAVENAEQEKIVTETIVTETIVTESPQRQTGERRRESTEDASAGASAGDVSDDRPDNGFSGEHQATVELLLDWIVVPGNYSRWWLQRGDVDKPQPLWGEINVFLSSHGRRGLTSSEIKMRIDAFTMSFEAAYTWLRQTAKTYPLYIVNLTADQAHIKSHVLQMCPHYARLAPILSPYANYDANTVDNQSISAAMPPIAISEHMNNNNNVAPYTHADGMSNENTSRKDKQLWKQNTGTTNEEDDADSEEKSQRRRLFELECARLQSEIETRNIQLLLEKALARKKLLDAGISAEEVDRIFPL